MKKQILILLLGFSITLNLFADIYSAIDADDTEKIKTLIKEGFDINDSETKDPPLSYSIRQGSFLSAAYLLEMGADPSAPSIKHGTTPLIEAVKKKNYDMTLLLLEHGADVNYMTKFKLNALNTAVISGESKITELLLDYRAEFDNSTLITAVEMGDNAMVSLLVKKGADINEESQYKFTPLMRAIFIGNKEMTTLLISLGADIEKKNSRNETPLITALLMEKNEIAALLLDKGASVHVKNSYNLSPLALAYATGDIELAERIKDLGAVPGKSGLEAQIILASAIRYNWIDMTLSLLDENIDVNENINGGYTYLHVAADNNATETMKILLKKGADSDPVSADGVTPLMMALENEHLAAAKLLLSEGASPLRKMHDGQPLLHYMIKKTDIGGIYEVLNMWELLSADLRQYIKEIIYAEGDYKPYMKEDIPLDQLKAHLEMIAETRISLLTLIADHMEDLNITDKEGITPLIAAVNSHPQLLKILLDRGAGINNVDMKGQTALIHAVQKEESATMEYLLNRGADLHIRDNSGYTALWHSLHNRKIFMILLKRGAVILPEYPGDKELLKELQKSLIGGLQ